MILLSDKHYSWYLFKTISYCFLSILPDLFTLLQTGYFEWYILKTIVVWFPHWSVTFCSGKQLIFWGLTQSMVHYGSSATHLISVLLFLLGVAIIHTAKTWLLLVDSVHSGRLFHISVLNFAGFQNLYSTV